jgi:hypothetical protein
MFLKHAKLALATALMSTLPLVAVASGSEGVSGGETSDAQMYNVGKAVYAQKLACSNCPLAGKPLNAMLAKELLAGNQTQSLNADDKTALASYLKRRFKL